MDSKKRRCDDEESPITKYQSETKTKLEQKRQQLLRLKLFRYDLYFATTKSIAYFQKEVGFSVQDILRLSFYKANSIVELGPLCYAQGLFVRWDNTKKQLDAKRIVICEPFFWAKGHISGTDSLPFCLRDEDRHIEYYSAFMKHPSFVLRLFYYYGTSVNPLEVEWKNINNMELLTFNGMLMFLKHVCTALFNAGYHYVFRRDCSLPFLDAKQLDQLKVFDQIKDPLTSDYPAFFGKPQPLGMLPSVYRYMPQLT